MRLASQYVPFSLVLETHLLHQVIINFINLYDDISTAAGFRNVVRALFKIDCCHNKTNSTVLLSTSVSNQEIRVLEKVAELLGGRSLLKHLGSMDASQCSKLLYRDTQHQQFSSQKRICEGINDALGRKRRKEKGLIHDLRPEMQMLRDHFKQAGNVKIW